MERMCGFICTKITSTTMNISLFYLLVISFLVGASSGYLGSFMVLKRMSLVGDALSHVALPGIAIALAIGINPMLGAIFLLMIAVVGIWFLEERSEIYPEALVGLFFIFSLAVGVLITPDTELFEALFGDIERISFLEGLIVILASLFIFLIARKISDSLILGIVSEDLAKSVGKDISKINLIYLLLVGLVVALGVKFIGTLLTGALVIIPAVTAKNVSKGLSQFNLISISVGSFSAIGGVLIAKIFSLPPGPCVVIFGILLFSLSFLLRNIRIVKKYKK